MIPCEGTPPKRSLALGCAGADPSRAAGRSTTAAPHFGRGVASRGAPLVHRLPVGPAAGCAARWLWVAADGTYYAGGGTQQNGGPTTARQDNSRIGLIAALTVAKGQQVKMSFSSGASARAGSKFTTWGVGYQVLWF